MSQTFGQRIREARQEKGHSQRALAKLVGVDYTYLSKIENDRSEYPPKEDVIQSLAKHLDLDATELSYLSGRISTADAKAVQELAKQYQKEMPALLRRMQDPQFVKKVMQEEQDNEEEI